MNARGGPQPSQGIPEGESTTTGLAPTPDQPDCPRTRPCSFSSFFSKENKSKEWSLCLPAQECDRSVLGIVPGLGWEMCRDRAGECQEQGWEMLGLDWDQTGNCAWIGARSVPASGWGAPWDWAGKCLVWGVERSGSGLGSSAGMSWELCPDWAGKFTGMNWEAHLDCQD